MSEDSTPPGDEPQAAGGGGRTAGFSLGGAVIGFLFGGLILDDLALGIVFGFFGGIIGAGAARARLQGSDRE